MLAAFGPYIGFIWCAFNIPGYAGFYVHQWDISLRNLQNVRWVSKMTRSPYDETDSLGCAYRLDMLLLHEPSHQNRNSSRMDTHLCSYRHTQRFLLDLLDDDGRSAHARHWWCHGGLP